MIGLARTLVMLAASLVFLTQALASAHVHEDEPSLASCDVCLVAGHADEALPAPDPSFGPPVALPEPVVRAYAAQLALVPPAAPVPPGRAPPLTL